MAKRHGDNLNNPAPKKKTTNVLSRWTSALPQVIQDGLSTLAEILVPPLQEVPTAFTTTTISNVTGLPVGFAPLDPAHQPIPFPEDYNFSVPEPTFQPVNQANDHRIRQREHQQRQSNPFSSREAPGFDFGQGVFPVFNPEPPLPEQENEAMNEPEIATPIVSILAPPTRVNLFDLPVNPNQLPAKRNVARPSKKPRKVGTPEPTPMLDFSQPDLLTGGIGTQVSIIDDDPSNYVTGTSLQEQVEIETRPKVSGAKTRPRVYTNTTRPDPLMLDWAKIEKNFEILLSNPIENTVREIPSLDNRLAIARGSTQIQDIITKLFPKMSLDYLQSFEFQLFLANLLNESTEYKEALKALLQDKNWEAFYTTSPTFKPRTANGLQLMRRILIALMVKLRREDISEYAKMSNAKDRMMENFDNPTSVLLPPVITAEIIPSTTELKEDLVRRLSQPLKRSDIPQLSAQMQEFAGDQGFIARLQNLFEGWLSGYLDDETRSVLFDLLSFIRLYLLPEDPKDDDDDDDNPPNNPPANNPDEPSTYLPLLPS